MFLAHYTVRAARAAPWFSKGAALDIARHPDQRSAALAELSLGGLQRLRDPVKRYVEALLEAARLEEAELLAALVTLPPAAVSEGVDLPAFALGARISGLSPSN